MRTKLSIAWNIALLLLAAALSLIVAPKVYNQAHYQFTDPKGGPSMWPATFEGFLALTSVLIGIAAFSFLFGGSLGIVRRCFAGLLALGLLAAWIVAASLWQGYMPGISQESLVTHMMRLESSFVNAIGIAALTIAAVVGKGPLTTLYDLLRKFRARSRPVA